MARGAPSDQVLGAVAEEVGRLLAVEYVALSRYESDRTLTYVASWSASGKPFPPIGTRVIIGGRNVSSLVFDTGRAARIDNYADASGPFASAIREEGVRSAVGTPIVVEGRVWGVIGVGSVRSAPLPEDAEGRSIGASRPQEQHAGRTYCLATSATGAPALSALRRVTKMSKT